MNIPSVCMYTNYWITTYNQRRGRGNGPLFVVSQSQRFKSATGISSTNKTSGTTKKFFIPILQKIIQFDCIPNSSNYTFRLPEKLSLHNASHPCRNIIQSPSIPLTCFINTPLVLRYNLSFALLKVVQGRS